MTSFRVWAPKASRVDVALEDSADPKAHRRFHPLTAEPDGYFAGIIPAQAGDLYRFRLDGAEAFYPDPASRYQAEGPHRSSMIIDPTAFRWSDATWPGIQMPGQIIYEMHVGTFTSEGTWRAAAEKLPHFQTFGISVIEMMPVPEFAGEFGWGYDGVDLFAPTHLYGSPDNLRAFVDRAHSLGIGVILDVVYNHLGPEGNYLRIFSDSYFTDRYKNDWGEAINFDGDDAGPVREFFISNARYWIEEFHFDGFRFDATQNICDKSDDYIVGEIGRAARAAAGQRSIILVAENEAQESKLVRPRAQGGDELDGLWNDDLHHSAMIALGKKREAYYSDYAGSAQELVSAAKYGYLFQGQPYSWQDAPRGQPTFGLPPAAFIAFTENHDQISNSAFGERIRCLTSAGKYRAMTALLLLGPWTPMLFQGQEFGATTSFVYFCDIDSGLREAIRKGRFEFLRQFPSIAKPEIQKQLPAPAERSSFTRSKLQWEEAEKFPEISALHRDLIQLRKNEQRFRAQKTGAVDGAVLSDEAFVLRFLGDDVDDRLLLINLGEARDNGPLPEPLLAPPLGHRWETLWSSDTARYGGPGEKFVAGDRRWTIPAEAAVVLRPVPEPQRRRARTRQEIEADQCS